MSQDTYGIVHTGFLCPECGSGNVAVIDSRSWYSYIRRRRRCEDCRHPWTTAELPMDMVHDFPRVLKRFRALRDDMTAVLGQAEDVKFPDIIKADKRPPD